MKNVPSIKTIDEIPESPAYAYVHDKYMSGWGQSDGGMNLLVLLCEKGELETIEHNCSKDEFLDVIYSGFEKSQFPSEAFLIEVKTEESMSRLYKPFASGDAGISYQSAGRRKEPAATVSTMCMLLQK